MAFYWGHLLFVKGYVCYVKDRIYEIMTLRRLYEVELYPLSRFLVDEINLVCGWMNCYIFLMVLLFFTRIQSDERPRPVFWNSDTEISLVANSIFSFSSCTERGVSVEWLRTHEFTHTVMSQSLFCSGHTSTKDNSTNNIRSEQMRWLITTNNQQRYVKTEWNGPKKCCQTCGWGDCWRKCNWQPRPPAASESDSCFKTLCQKLSTCFNLEVCNTSLRDGLWSAPDCGLPLHSLDQILGVLAIANTEDARTTQGDTLPQWLVSLKLEDVFWNQNCPCLLCTDPIDRRRVKYLDRNAGILWPGCCHCQCSFCICTMTNSNKEFSERVSI